MSFRTLGAPTLPIGRKKGVAPIDKGGTGSTTREGAVQALGGILTERIGLDLLAAGPGGKLPTSALPPALAMTNTIQGPVTIVRGSTVEYLITSYDENSPPSVSIDRGSVVRTGAVIQVTAPSEGSSVTLNIGGREVSIPLVNAGANAPVITYPESGSRTRGAVTFVLENFVSNVETYTSWTAANSGTISVPSNASMLEIRGRRGEEGVGRVRVGGEYHSIGIMQSQKRVPISGSTALFEVSGGAQLEYRWVRAEAEHVSTDWEVATDAAMTNIVRHSRGDTVNLLSWEVELPQGSYYARARFNGEIEIEGQIAKPTITHPTSGSSISAISETFVASSFLVNGFDVHASSDWEIATDANFTNIVKSNLHSSSNLTTWGVTGLAFTTQYYVRVRYRGMGGEVSDWSGVVAFETGEEEIVEIHKPSIIYPSMGSTVSPTAIGFLASSFSANGSDIHASSDWEIATDVNFTNIVRSSIGSTTNLTSWNVIGMDSNKTYYARVRHRGMSGGVSDWSNVVGFSTALGELAEVAQFQGPSNSSYFGTSVSISGNGNTAIVGAPGVNTNSGKAFIYTRSGATWTQQADLQHSLDGYPMFGTSVSLSADGNTAIVGASHWSNESGTAYIYTRSGSTWARQAVLSHYFGGLSNFGASVSLSADGNTAIVGAPRWNSRKGKALVYSRSGGAWTQQADLPNSLGISSSFGVSVSLSADGNTAIVGSTAGAFIYTRSGTTWTEQADLEGGYPVALSADGNTAIVSGGIGSVYTRSGTTWTLQADLPHWLDTDSWSGVSVSLSADGNIAIVGAGQTGLGNGKALVYTRSGSTWILEADLPNSLGGSSYFGYSVSISGDGSRAIVGASRWSSHVGKALIYSR